MSGLKLNTNIPAYNTRRNLLIQNDKVARSMEKLSSGLRINRAADDAAGLSIAENLRAQVIGLNRAVANAQDAISLLQTAEGALSENHNTLHRMRYLAVQAANGTLTSRDRSAIQDEVAQLIDEVDRIALTTQFNSINLLNGNVGALVSTDDPNNITGILVDDVGEGGTFCIQVAAVTVGKLQVQNSDIFVTIKDNGDAVNAHSNTQLQSISRLQTFGVFAGGIDSVNLTLSSDTGNKVTNVQVFATDTLGQLSQKISLAINDPAKNTDLGMAADLSDGASLVYVSSLGPCGSEDTATTLVITTPEPGGKLVFGGNPNLLSALSLHEVQDPVAPLFSVTASDIGQGKISTKSSRVYGSRAAGLIQGLDLEFRTTLDISISASEKTLINAFSIAQLVNNSSAGADGFIVHVAPRPLSFQIGPNHGDFINTQIGDMTAKSLGIDGLNISNQFLAQETLKTIDSAIGVVSAQRSSLGAIQNRLESTIANLNVAEENLAASESQIRDLDYSDEILKFTAAQILTNSGSNFLAQANSLSQMVLQLIS
ncbi:MAG: flagellin [Gemmatimonadota bacterium]|nr:flagellin [Gemmatimonadota bacterium]